MLEHNLSTAPALNEPLVTAVIINWNGKELALRLLESLEKVNYSNLKIIVVDNASSDGSIEAIGEKRPKVEVIENSRNMGYCAAVNQGISRSVELGANYTWVLNNDVVVYEDTLMKLVEAIESDDKVAAVGPLVYDLDNPDTLAHPGYSVSLWTGIMRKRWDKRGADAAYEVDSAFGCSNLVRTSAVVEVGGYDERFNVYFDETDLNARLKKAGHKVLVVPGAKVLHEESATMNRTLLIKAWLLLRNLFLFEVKNASPAQLAVFIPYFFLIHIPYFFLLGTVTYLRRV